MVKHTQTIRPQQPTNCLSVFDHFMGLALEGLKIPQNFFEALTRTSFFLRDFLRLLFLIGPNILAIIGPISISYINFIFTCKRKSFKNASCWFVQVCVVIWWTPGTKDLSISEFSNNICMCYPKTLVETYFVQYLNGMFESIVLSE